VFGRNLCCARGRPKQYCRRTAFVTRWHNNIGNATATFPSGRCRLHYDAEHKTGIPRFLCLNTAWRFTHTLALAHINIRRTTIILTYTLHTEKRVPRTDKTNEQKLIKMQVRVEESKTDFSSIFTDADHRSRFTFLHRSCWSYRRCC